jgi:hypothetical protein
VFTSIVEKRTRHQTIVDLHNGFTGSDRAPTNHEDHAVECVDIDTVFECNVAQSLRIRLP